MVFDIFLRELGDKFMTNNDILRRIRYILGYNDKKMLFLSTEAMINRAKETASKNIIVATETGVIHKLKKNSPDKNFIPINKSATCKYMKMITVDKVLKTLKSESPEVKVEKYIAAKAKTATDRMVGLV